MDNKRSFWRLGFKWRRTPFVAPSGKLVGVTQIDGTEKIIPNSELHTELRSLTYTGQRLREALFEKKARNMFAPKKEMTPIPQASLIALRGLSKRLFEEVAALDFVGVQESKRPQRDLGPSGRFHYVYYLACYDPAICDDDDQPVFHRARAPLSAGIEVEAVEEFRVNAAHYCDDDKLTLIRLDITSTRWQKYVDGVWQELAE